MAEAALRELSDKLADRDAQLCAMQQRLADHQAAYLAQHQSDRAEIEDLSDKLFESGAASIAGLQRALAKSGAALAAAGDGREEVPYEQVGWCWGRGGDEADALLRVCLMASVARRLVQRAGLAWDDGMAHAAARLCANAKQAFSQAALQAMAVAIARTGRVVERESRTASRPVWALVANMQAASNTYPHNSYLRSSAWWPACAQPFELTRAVISIIVITFATCPAQLRAHSCGAHSCRHRHPHNLDCMLPCAAACAV